MLGDIAVQGTYERVNDKLHPHRYYYVDDFGKIYKVSCPKDTRVFDRSTCAEKMLRIPMEPFFSALKQKFGRGIEEANLKVEQAWINIQKIDNKLLELATEEPNTDELDKLTRSIEEASLALTTEQTRLTEIKDQIARIEHKLKVTRDFNLVSQLELLRKSIPRVVEEVERLKLYIIELRQQLVTSIPIHSEADFRDLTTMRKRFIKILEEEKNRVGVILEDMIKGELVSNRLREQGFTWIADATQPRSFPGLERLEETFSEVFEQTIVLKKAFSFPEQSFEVFVYSGRKPSNLYCRFVSIIYKKLLGDRSCHLQLEAPGNRKVNIEAMWRDNGDGRYYWGLNFPLSSTFYRDNRAVLENAGFFDVDMPDGIWKADLSACLPPPAEGHPDRQRLDEITCELNFEVNPIGFEPDS